MISNKYKLSLILSILLSNCSFFNIDSESTDNYPVGTWNVTTVKYFGNLDCSGDPGATIVLDSLEQIMEFGIDEFQLELTITLDAYMIGILTGSALDSDERGEIISTGIITYPRDELCVSWHRRDGVEFWLDGRGDGCDACRDYIINGDELEMRAYNCPIPPSPGVNNPCLIYTMEKK